MTARPVAALVPSALLELRPIGRDHALARALKTERTAALAAEAALSSVAPAVFRKRYDDTFRAAKKGAFVATLVSPDGEVFRPEGAGVVGAAVRFAAAAIAAGVDASLARLRMNGALVQQGFDAILLTAEDAPALAAAEEALRSSADAAPFYALLAATARG
ncbi:hypothetical protein HQQ81_09080 [Microbacteriaceae bacterium VKM Ac-2854]|nr:hypothetical protein [Microbacteriaceae bacterium VKM Ac-2854]